MSAMEIVTLARAEAEADRVRVHLDCAIAALSIGRPDVARKHLRALDADAARVSEEWLAAARALPRERA